MPDEQGPPAAQEHHAWVVPDAGPPARLSAATPAELALMIGTALRSAGGHGAFVLPFVGTPLAITRDGGHLVTPDGRFPTRPDEDDFEIAADGYVGAFAPAEAATDDDDSEEDDDEYGNAPDGDEEGPEGGPEDEGDEEDDEAEEGEGGGGADRVRREWPGRWR